MKDHKWFVEVVDRETNKLLSSYPFESDVDRAELWADWLTNKLDNTYFEVILVSREA